MDHHCASPERDKPGTAIPCGILSRLTCAVYCAETPGCLWREAWSQHRRTRCLTYILLKHQKSRIQRAWFKHPEATVDWSLLFFDSYPCNQPMHHQIHWALLPKFRTTVPTPSSTANIISCLHCWIAYFLVCPQPFHPLQLILCKALRGLGMLRQLGGKMDNQLVFMTWPLSFSSAPSQFYSALTP